MERPMILSRRHCLGSLTAAIGSVGIGVVPVRAEVTPTAREAYLAGRWNEPSQLPRLADNADNLAFAARSLLAGALLDGPAPTREPAARRAKALCDQALRLEPRHIEARLQTCVALAMQSRANPVRAVMRDRTPQRSLVILQAILTDAPNEPWVHALIGGWNLEALRLGGMAARTMLGASLERGKASYARALDLSNEPVIPFSFAASLVGIDPVIYRNEALRLLDRARNATAVGVFETSMRSRAALLAGLLAANNPTQARTRVVQWL
jgi:hypothetical protein